MGPSTWERVAAELNGRQRRTLVPTLTDDATSSDPYWQQHAQAVAQAATQLPANEQLVLVAHSGAGPLLPAIREQLQQSVVRYIFVDAGMPHHNLTRLEQMALDDADWAASFRTSLEQGARYPTWQADDLQSIIPLAEARRRLVAEIKPRDLSFFNEPIPVFADWPDAPGAYIHFTPPYNYAAERAAKMGWPVHKHAAGHFHMLVNPQQIASLLLADEL